MTAGNKMVAPDGGYGWVIVGANAINNIMIITLASGFALIYKDTFDSMGISATQVTFLINLASAFGMLVGPFTGLFIKWFGCRVVALASAVFMSLGIVFTSFATTYTHFLLTYGIITSLGIGLALPSFNIAIMAYFEKRRSKAFGINMTITGLGVIVSPQVIYLLMTEYSIQGATLILGGIGFHCILAAMLLHPVQWHSRNPDKDLKEIEMNVSNYKEIPQQNKDLTEESKEKNGTQSVIKDGIRQRNRRLRQAAKFLDFDLLKDPIYLSIMFGMAIMILAENNFVTLMALILGDFGLENQKIATFLSVEGAADLCFRFISPFIESYFKLSPRTMFIIALISLMITRFALMLANSYSAMLTVAVFMGVAQGFKNVYMSLVVPAYVPIDKLATAFGMQLFLDGLCILLGGSLVGIFRDITGSYKICIVILNALMFVTVLMWTIEFIIVKCVQRRKSLRLAQEQRDLL